jgi:hypothetical protein
VLNAWFCKPVEARAPTGLHGVLQRRSLELIIIDLTNRSNRMVIYFPVDIVFGEDAVSVGCQMEYSCDAARHAALNHRKNWHKHEWLAGGDDKRN